MKLSYILKKELAPLAWVASINNAVVTVTHGNQVETYSDFFVAGAWNGSFSKGNFIESDWFCGTGATLKKNKIIFSTPSHVTTSLFYDFNAISGEIVVSNSLHLLCAYAGYHLDAQYVNYECDFNSILFGIYKYKRHLKVLEQNNHPKNITTVYFRHIAIDDQNHLSEEVKQPADPFVDFSDYYSRLCKAISGLIQNAADPMRKVAYGTVTTISKGYDAPCCATIAKKYGCNTALTFQAKGKYSQDSGVEIAKKLGYPHIIEQDAQSYLTRTDLVETLAISSGELGTDLHFIAFEQNCKNNLVFTGDRGDRIWNIHTSDCNKEFSFVDTFNHRGASERHLWVAYIPVPMPLYGASQWPSIQAISQSKEMEPWSLQNNYNRPIPRRICEEANLPREMFGIKKQGAGINLRFDLINRIRRRLSPAAATNFTQFVRETKKFHPVQVISYFWKTRKLYLARIGIHAGPRMNPRDISQIPNATAARYLFPWAGEKVIQAYQKALGR